MDRVAQELSIDYFIVGATARDIVLYGVFGIAPDRRTLDVDLGVAVRDWPQFERVKAALTDDGQFAADRATPHRLFRMEDRSRKSHPLDLLPFGGVEDDRHRIVWPPDLSIAMDVTGYREALAAAPEVEIAPDFVVRVASLAGLAILKLLAWADRGLEDPRDAADLVILMRRYAEAGNEGRLYGEEIGVLETVAHDVDLAGPRLLGKDAGRIITDATHDHIFVLLREDAVVARLVKDMARSIRGVEDSITEAETLLAQFRQVSKSFEDEGATRSSAAAARWRAAGPRRRSASNHVASRRTALLSALWHTGRHADASAVPLRAAHRGHSSRQ